MSHIRKNFSSLDTDLKCSVFPIFSFTANSLIIMDKASKALRRSGVRIRSIGSGHSDLQMVIAQLKDVRTTGKVRAQS